MSKKMEHKSYFGPAVMRASRFCLIFLWPLPSWGEAALKEWLVRGGFNPEPEF